MLLSQGLSEAYRIESRVAQNPKISLSENAWKFIDQIKDDSERIEVKELISIEEDLPFLCYLLFHDEDEWYGGETFYDLQKKMVTTQLSSYNLPDRAKEKLIWVAHYHNWALSQTARILKISGILSEDDWWWFQKLWIDGVSGDRQFTSAIYTDPSADHLLKMENEQFHSRLDGANRKFWSSSPPKFWWQTRDFPTAKEWVSKDPSWILSEDREPDIKESDDNDVPCWLDWDDAKFRKLYLNEDWKQLNGYLGLLRATSPRVLPSSRRPPS